MLQISISFFVATLTFLRSMRSRFTRSASIFPLASLSFMDSLAFSLICSLFARLTSGFWSADWTFLNTFCAAHNLHLQAEPSYGGRDYLEKQDFIIEKQKKILSAQGEALTKNTVAIAEQEKKFDKAAKAVSEKEKELEKQEGLIAEKGRELSEKRAALATVTMKIADMESLVEEVADTAYEKACEVVADTVRAETQKEDIRAVEDYKKWLASPERKAPQEKRDFAVKCLCTVQEQIKNAAQKVLRKVQSALQKPEVSRANKEQIKEKARESMKDRLARGKIEADRVNRERMERRNVRVATKKDMEI